MTTKKDKVLDEMMDIWDTLEIVKNEYLTHGINIDDLFPEETQRFLRYIRFDKQCIIMKREYMKHLS
jgi:hypothetical protein